MARSSNSNVLDQIAKFFLLLSEAHSVARSFWYWFEVLSCGAKFAAKYQKTVEAIANHIQKDYKGGGGNCKGSMRPEPPRD
jgi:hypothetical protein